MTSTALSSTPALQFSPLGQAYTGRIGITGNSSRAGTGRSTYDPSATTGINSGFHAPTLDEAVQTLAGIPDNLDFDALMSAYEKQLPGIDDAWKKCAAENSLPAKLNNAPGQALFGQPLTYSGSLTPGQIAALNSGTPSGQVITPQTMNLDLAAQTQNVLAPPGLQLSPQGGTYTGGSGSLDSPGPAASGGSTYDPTAATGTNSGFHEPTLVDAIQALADIPDNLDFEALMFAYKKQLPGIESTWKQYAAENRVPEKLNNAPGESLSGQPLTYSGSLTHAQIAALNSGTPSSQVITAQTMNLDLAAQMAWDNAAPADRTGPRPTNIEAS